MKSTDKKRKGIFNKFETQDDSTHFVCILSLEGVQANSCQIIDDLKLV